MLKLIPREILSPEQKNNKSKHSLKHGTPKISTQPRRVGVNSAIEDHLLKNVCFYMMDYIKKAQSYGIKEIGELIHQLQRSVLILEKKRIRLIKKHRNKYKAS